MKLSIWLRRRARSWNGVFSSGSRKSGALSVSISGGLFQHLAGGVAAGQAEHATSRVTAGAAQEQPADRRSVGGSARHRAQHEDLVERELGVVPVTAADANLALDVGRSEQLRTAHARAQSRSEALERVDHQIG